MPRSDLVGRNAVLDVGPVRFARVAAGQPRGRRACVVAAAVTERERVALGQTREHVDAVLDRRERLQQIGQFIVRALDGRGPVRHVHAVGHEQKGRAHRTLGRRLHAAGLGQRAKGHHSVQQGQGHRGAHAAQQGSAGNLGFARAHGFPFLLCFVVRLTGGGEALFGAVRFLFR
jgi:hypothetical protein